MKKILYLAFSKGVFGSPSFLIGEEIFLEMIGLKMLFYLQKNKE